MCVVLNLDPAIGHRQGEATLNRCIHRCSAAVVDTGHFTNRFKSANTRAVWPILDECLSNGMSYLSQAQLLPLVVVVVDSSCADLLKQRLNETKM